MTEKLGVLLVDVPEPRDKRYYFAVRIHDSWDIFYANYNTKVRSFAYRCTQEEAKKYPQFRWVSLEELE